MKNNKITAVVFVLILLLVLLYLLGIFSVNFGGRAYNDYDIYADTILAKYIGSEKTLFPEKWHFGNQIYTVATPAVTGLLYPFLPDAYCAMATASCIMTLLILASFLWCVKPFLKAQYIAVGLLILIGGTNIGQTAHRDLSGLQLFYTMASYYACYVIGILLTLGVYNRYSIGLPLQKIMLTAAILLNYALGIQSLREMLVLNLPLCALTIVQHFLLRGTKDLVASHKKAGIFAVVTLLANALGILTSKLLSVYGIICQVDILQETKSQLLTNVKLSCSAFTQYIGLTTPRDLFSTFRLTVALLSLTVVAAALVLVLFRIIRQRGSVIAVNILFFLISLSAVFFAGILVLELRPIYFFCWHLMVAFCAMYLLDAKWSCCAAWQARLKNAIVLILIVISTINCNNMFQNSYREMRAAWDFYEDIAQQLQEDGIKYIYTDSWSEQPMIATMSNDEIVYTVLSFSGTPQDLWYKMPYLYHEDWFDPANFENAYILLTDRTLHRLESSFPDEYRTELMANLQLVHTFSGNNTNLYLYQGSEKLYQDICN